MTWMPRLNEVIKYKHTQETAEVVNFVDDGNVIVCEWRDRKDKRNGLRFFIEIADMDNWETC